jgi:hypothetical protein
MLAREVGSESTAERRITKPKDKAAIRELYKPADAETTSLLHGICGKLGHLPEGEAYVLGVDFNDALNDLVKLLAADEGPLLLKLGEMQVIDRHLVPMLCVIGRIRFEEELMTLLNIIILLTSADISAPRASPGLLLDLRRQYKKSFEGEKVMSTLLDLAVSCVTPKSETAMADRELLRKIFTLLRNSLATPDASSHYASNNVALASSFGRQERLISGMRSTRLLEFLIVAASSCNDRRDGRIFGPHATLLLQIFHCIFASYDPDVIASMWNADEAGPQISETEQALQKEKKLRRPIRHGRFNGTVVVRLSVLRLND